MKPGSVIAVILFSLVGIAHLLRLDFQIEATVAGALVPMWVSVLGLLVPAAVALMLWREQRGYPDGSVLAELYWPGLLRETRCRRVATRRFAWIAKWSTAQETQQLHQRLLIGVSACLVPDRCPDVTPDA